MDARSVLRAMAAAGMAGVLGAVPAQAVDGCKAKIRKKDGVVEVRAKNVSGNLLWGGGSGDETNAFFNAASCVSGSKAKKCEVGDPATEAGRTPPASCTIYLADDTSSCSAYLKGCTPGVRSLPVAPPYPEFPTGTAGSLGGADWHVCRAGLTAWISAPTSDTYDAVVACQSLGYSGVDVWGGNCAERCGRCGFPGREFYDMNGGDDPSELGATVDWRCIP